MPPSRTGPKSQSDAGPGSQHSLNDPQRLVFIDETGASTKMAQLRGHALQGERCRAAVSHGHWKTTTFTGALRLDGITAPMVLDDPMNRVAFQAYIEQVLVPRLRRGDAVITNNLPAHKGAEVRRAIEAAGAACHLTHPTSTRSRPPFPSSRRSCGKRPHASSTTYGMSFATRDCANYFTTAGYESD